MDRRGRKCSRADTQVSTISTASNVVNTIMPVIGGIGMDYVGGVYAAFFACILCIVGSVTAACVSGLCSCWRAFQMVSAQTWRWRAGTPSVPAAVAA